MTAKSLLFDGTLELCGDDGTASGEPYWFETLADGAAWGDPQPVEVAINSLMRDGAIVATTGDDNREATFLVKVRGTDSDSLDAGVQALQLATRKRTTLVWTPPDDYCEPRAWDVETSNLLEPNGWDDIAYVKRNEQVFRLRLVCLPYRRSLTKVIDNAGTPPSSGGTLLYNCESTTGWSKWSTFSGGGGSNIGTTISVDNTVYTEGAGSVRSTSQYMYNYSGTQPPEFTSSDQVAGLSLSTGSGGYLSIAIRTAFTGGTRQALSRLWMTTSTGEQEITNFVATQQDAQGFTRFVWPVAAGLTITALRFGVNQKSDSFNPVGKAYVWYDDVSLLPAATTDHQIVKQLTVQGSARTPGSLRVAAPADSVALSRVLAITVPSNEIPAGFQPDGRRWVTQGTTTIDATALDGSYFTPNSSYSSAAGYPIFDVPVGMLAAGPYTVVALVKAEASSLTFGVQAQLRVGSTNTGPTSTAETSPQGLTTGWQFVTVGTVYLPPLPVQSADVTTKVRLLFKGAKMANVYMIPAWQVGGRPVADFSIVDCGTGTVAAGGASSNLWIDSPSTSQPQGGWWRGPTSDRANTQSAWPDAKKPGVHVFPPGSLSAFLVSTGAAGPKLTLEYYPAYL